MSNSFEPVEVRLAPNGNFLALPYDWLNAQKGSRALGFSFGLGAFSNLAFAPMYFWPILMIGFVSLIWLLDGATRQDNPRAASFWRVFFFAFGFFGIGFHWLTFAFLVDASAHAGFAWITLLLPITLAFIWAMSIRFVMTFWSPGPGRVFLFALIIFIAEWLRGHLFGGFPWNIPAMIWAPGGAVSQTASLFGVWGLSLISIFVLCAPAALCDARTHIGTKAGGVSRAAPIVIAAVAIGMTWGWGSNRLSESVDTATGPAIRLVDAGVPQSEKFKPDVRELVLRRYLTLTEPDNRNSPRIVIWPEGALPYALLQYPDALEPVMENIGGRKLIVGTSFVDRRNIPEKWYNALAVLSRESLVAEAIYYKHRLVPFGEMLPLRAITSRIGIPALQQIAQSGFHAGPPPSSISVEGVPDFQPLICYEALFPGLLPKREDRQSFSEADSEFSVERADWIVNISIDAWFGPLWAPYQHFEHAKYRAIEEGLPMVRVASRGISGVVDAYGRLTEKAIAPDFDVMPPDPSGWKARVLDANLPSALQPTIYSQYRDLLVLVLVLFLFIGWAITPRN